MLTALLLLFVLYLTIKFVFPDVPQNIFCGDDVTDLLFVQILKKLEFGGTTRIALATR